MRKYETITVPTDQLTEWTCDVCKRDLWESYVEEQEAFHFSETCGYGSVFGDGAKVSIDLCQHCFKRLLGEYVTVE